MHHSFPAPAKAEGTEAEVMNAFRTGRDDIEKVVTKLLKTNPEHSIPLSITGLSG